MRTGMLRTKLSVMRDQVPASAPDGYREPNFQEQFQTWGRVMPTTVGGQAAREGVVDEGHTGMLVPSADPVALSEAIRTYLVEPDKLGRHGRAARKRAKAEFTMEAMVNGYLSVYDEVLKRKGRR